MTRQRQQFTRPGSAHSFNSAATQRKRGMRALAAENERRVPCTVCGVGILPGAMHVHMEIAHGDD